MKSELIEKLNLLTSAVIKHRQEVSTQKLSTYEELKHRTASFYEEVFDRYMVLLGNTRKIYNSCEQYKVHTKHGVFTMGLAATGFFSSIAGWNAYSFGYFSLNYGGKRDSTGHYNKETLLKLRDFLNSLDWSEFDKQITEQAVKLFGKYEDETLKEELCQ